MKSTDLSETPKHMNSEETSSMPTQFKGTQECAFTCILPAVPRALKKWKNQTWSRSGHTDRRETAMHTFQLCLSFSPQRSPKQLPIFSYTGKRKSSPKIAADKPLPLPSAPVRDFCGVLGMMAREGFASSAASSSYSPQNSLMSTIQ